MFKSSILSTGNEPKLIINPCSLIMMSTYHIKTHASPITVKASLIFPRKSHIGIMYVASTRTTLMLEKHVWYFTFKRDASRYVYRCSITIIDLMPREKIVQWTDFQETSVNPLIQVSNSDHSNTILSSSKC